MIDVLKKKGKVPRDFVSTTSLSKILNISSKEVFDILTKENWVEKKEGKYILTTLGDKMGGQLKKSESGSDYIVWPIELKNDALFSKFLTIKIAESITATKIAEKLNLNSNKINSIFCELGWIKKDVRGYLITRAGELIGAEQVENEKDGYVYVTWPKNITESKPFQESISQFGTKNQNEKKNIEIDSNTLNEQNESAIPHIDIRKKFEAQLRATDGHYVRSKAEVIIDNYLYLKNLVHAYERRLPVEEDAYSDFYLPIGNIWIEYWGIENDPKYLERKKIKREIYKKYNLNLIELRNDDINNLDDILPKKLLKFSVMVA